MYVVNPLLAPLRELIAAAEIVAADPRLSRPRRRAVLAAIVAAKISAETNTQIWQPAD